MFRDAVRSFHWQILEYASEKNEKNRPTYCHQCLRKRVQLLKKRKKSRFLDFEKNVKKRKKTCAQFHRLPKSRYSMLKQMTRHW